MKCTFVVALISCFLHIAFGRVDGTGPNCQNYYWDNAYTESEVAPCVKFTGEVWFEDTNVRNLSGFAHVTSMGRLNINGAPDLVNVTLPSLVNVTGEFAIVAGAALKVVSLPALENAGAKFGIEMNANLETINLPMLTNVTGALALTKSSAATISLPKLKTVGGVVMIREHTLLSSVAFDVLTEIKGEALLFNDNGPVTSVTAPLLTTFTGTVQVARQTGAVALNLLPNLKVVDGPVYISESAMTSLTIAALEVVTGELDVELNAGLTSLSLPKLTTVGGLIVQGVSLTSVQFPDLRIANGDKIHDFLLPAMECLDARALLANMGQPDRSPGSCKVSRCPALGNVTNGYIPASFNYTYGAPSQSIQCNAGFEIIGDSRLCTAFGTGTWYGNDQVCVACTSGKFRAALQKSPECRTCPAGTVSGTAEAPKTDTCYCNFGGTYKPMALNGTAPCVSVPSRAFAAAAAVWPLYLAAALAVFTFSRV